MSASDIILKVENLTISYVDSRKSIGGKRNINSAVRNVSFSIKRGVVIDEICEAAARLLDTDHVAVLAANVLQRHKRFGIDAERDRLLRAGRPPCCCTDCSH